LIFQGSGGCGYVFAELAYRVHLRASTCSQSWRIGCTCGLQRVRRVGVSGAPAGFNVFVMPKHGGRTVNQLMSRHLEVLQYIRREFNDRIGLYGEGPGGYVAFYVALAHAPIVSLVCQNAPGDLD
jgi:hypothetical protein